MEFNSYDYNNLLSVEYTLDNLKNANDKSSILFNAGDNNFELSLNSSSFNFILDNKNVLSINNNLTLSNILFSNDINSDNINNNELSNSNIITSYLNTDNLNSLSSFSNMINTKNINIYDSLNLYGEQKTNLLYCNQIYNSTINSNILYIGNDLSNIFIYKRNYKSINVLSEDVNEKHLLLNNYDVGFSNDIGNLSGIYINNNGYIKTNILANNFLIKSPKSSEGGYILQDQRWFKCCTF
jgi:hypothetical protein